VCGAHLSGLPLNSELTRRGARLRTATRTAPRYRLFALAGGPPHRPGLLRDRNEGAAIEVEVWELTVEALGSLVSVVQAPLSIGDVELEDGSTVKGFLCEAYAALAATEITPFGGWRAYLATLAE
jgi:allophanate hydrolase